MQSGQSDLPSAPLEGVVFELSGEWWIAEYPPFPGAYSQGKTKAEAYRNLLSAMADLIETYARQAREHAA